MISNPRETIKSIFHKTKNIYFQDSVKNKYNLEILPTIEISSLFPIIQEKLDIYTFLSGTSTIPDLILLKLLAKRFGSECDYLEIGSWRGESAYNVSKVAKSVTMVTLGENEMRQKGFDEAFIVQNEFFTKGKSEFNVIHADSLVLDFETLGKKFDLVFIDGDHQYKSITSDTRNVMKVLKNTESIIVWHDYGFDPETVRYETLSAIFDSIPQEKHQFLYHVSNTLCAIYLEKYDGPLSISKFPSTPKTIFEVDIKSKKLE
jgi:predicted O-methyltransferase YrrM